MKTKQIRDIMSILLNKYSSYNITHWKLPEIIIYQSFKNNKVVISNAIRIIQSLNGTFPNNNHINMKE